MDLVEENNIPVVATVFDDYLAGQISEGTRRVYERDIKQIFGGKIPTWEQIKNLTPDHVIAWRNAVWNNGDGLAATTINRKLTAIKTFYDHLVARRLLAYNPINPKLVRRIKEKRNPGAKMGITVEELQSLLAACSRGKNTKANERDYTIISLLYSCLLRRSEVAAFKWGDLEKDGGRSLLRLPLTKGGANDFVPLEPTMIEQLNRYYLAMGGAESWLAWFGKPIGDCPVFVALDNGHRGEQLSDHGINEIVKKRAKMAGIQPISAHILRHTGITHALQDGHQLGDVQALARHSDPKMTMNYAVLLRRLENSPGKSLVLNI